MDDPPVKLAIRTGNGQYKWRMENEWPLARTQWTKFHLDLGKGDGQGTHGTLVKANPAATASRNYAASGATSAGHASAASTTNTHGGPTTMGISLVTPPLDRTPR